MDVLNLYRAGFLFAWLLGVVAIGGAAVTGTEASLVLITPAGLVMSALGLGAVFNWRGILDRASRHYRNKLTFRLAGKDRFTRFEACVLLVIGIGWTGLGVARTLI